MKKSLGIYWNLFCITFSLSCFTFGGGFVIIPLMRKKFVDEYHWVSENEMMDFAAIAQSSPGAIAVNASILIGYRLGGIAGSLVAIIGTVSPPLLILTLVSHFYNLFSNNQLIAFILKAIQAGVAAIIADVVCTMSKESIRERGWINLLLTIIAFIASFFFNFNIIVLLISYGILGLIFWKVNVKRGVVPKT